MPQRTELASIKLDRVRFNIRRGTLIGGYRDNYIPCRARTDKIQWNRGRVTLRDVELNSLFFEEMDAAGFNVVGDPSELFADRDEVAPDYLIGAEVEEIKMDICDHVHWWTERHIDQQSGKASLSVSWQIFSPLRDKVVYQTVTQGFAQTEEPQHDGEILLLTEAFADAIASLANDRELIAWLQGSPAYELTPKHTDTMTVPLVPIGTQPIEERIEDIRQSVVTITDGLGHGSGFFISPRHVVTNHHVVRGRDRVRISTVTGAEHLAEVIRTHPERDVALLVVENRGFRPLAIREKPLSIAEEVYAVGTPLDASLGATVTKGIVSALRANRFGLPDIQADVDIQPGNSGGPLLDKHGNVVGISYAGVQNAGTSIGVNFFVPIGDGLDHLGVEVE
ncbi:MAG: trypsin-like peptidase domain-containing protein [Rhodovibrionaceae bacterium]|nr:trypsin-like peptidase domain-containing protein [Rhodovibrionaceae bacterium]